MRKTTRKTTLLGLDFGERRIGVALSDPDQLIAIGLTTLDCKQTPNIFPYLKGIIAEEDVSGIVVGYPLRTDGIEKPGSKTEAVDAFIAELEEKLQLPVYREDEAYTSQLAQASLKARGGKKGRNNKADIDRVAACYILQDYLNRQKEKI
jgi:putative holliday junction resolvase